MREKNKVSQSERPALAMWPGKLLNDNDYIRTMPTYGIMYVPLSYYPYYLAHKKLDKPEPLYLPPSQDLSRSPPNENCAKFTLSHIKKMLTSCSSQELKTKWGIMGLKQKGFFFLTGSRRGKKIYRYKDSIALASVVQMVGASSINQRIKGSIPSEGTWLGCGSKLVRARGRGNQSLFLSHSSVSLPLSPSPFPSVKSVRCLGWR